MIKEIKNDTKRSLPLEELEKATGGSIVESADNFGRTVYDVYSDRTEQLIGRFYNVYEAINCNERENG